MLDESFAGSTWPSPIQIGDQRADSSRNRREGSFTRGTNEALWKTSEETDGAVSRFGVTRRSDERVDRERLALLDQNAVRETSRVLAGGFENVVRSSRRERAPSDVQDRAFSV